MEFETLVFVTGLADDHALAREALEAVVEHELIGAVVLDPVAPPDLGFEFVVTANGDATDVCSRLRARLAEELHEREIMFAGLSVRAATNCAPCGNFCDIELS
ncbi:MAG: hypothetical protein IPM35_33620 [Myxococcales bacterium]|nr:hypothetical protein [Myxococcales bacterium]